MHHDFLQFVRDNLGAMRPSEFEAVSQKTGVPLGTIRKIHYGEVTDPRIGTIQALYDYFRALPPKKEAA